MKHTLSKFTGLCAIVMGCVTGAPAISATANGPYYAMPSWDQTLPASTRFIVLTNFNNAAVLDRETGLVWEAAPNPVTATWANAQKSCIKLILGNHRGWRLPSIQELASLQDPSMAPLLPAGHPFQNIQVTFNSGNHYWSTTTVAKNPSNAWALNFFNGAIEDLFDKTASLYVWCVRSGSGTDAQ